MKVVAGLTGLDIDRRKGMSAGLMPNPAGEVEPLLEPLATIPCWQTYWLLFRKPVHPDAPKLTS